MKANDDMADALERDGYLTVARAAALLAGLRPRTVYRWVDRGEIRRRRVGGRLFVHRADVERMLGLGAKEAG